MRFVGYTTVDQPLIAKVLTDKDLAIQDLKNNFFTRRGERLMDPDFGSIIPEMILNRWMISPRAKFKLMQNVLYH